MNDAINSVLIPLATALATTAVEMLLSESER